MSFSRVKIAARLRPPIPGEQHDNAIRVLRQERAGQAHEEIIVDNPRDPSQTFNYPFSSCYDEGSTQVEIFERDVKPLIDLAFSGMTVTVFAYGVTSSGKTHTMQGDSQQPGIIPRAVQEIFNRTTSQHVGASIAVSYMEIYKDEVYDLLVDRESATKLPVRETGSGQVFVANLSTLPLETLDDFEEAFAQANSQRSVGSTKLNSVSSRSHAILTLHVTVNDPSQNCTLSGKLNLVDLAGSENNKLTGNDASRMAESAAINKSLSVLGQVVHALNQGASRIPYRNSKLTRILQDALGGNSVGLLICNLAPGTKFRQDTLNTLNFAVRTKNIQNKPLVNQQANSAAGPSRLAPPPASTQTLARLPAPGAGPRPSGSRVPRMSGVGAGAGPRSSLAFSGLPPPMAKRKENVPPAAPAAAVPAHLTEEEINARIAKAVELEVARRLEEREREEAARRESQNQSQSLSMGGQESASGAMSLPAGLLSPLLKQRHSADEQLKARLEELESRFERGSKEKDRDREKEKEQVKEKERPASEMMSPISRKKTGRAYVALARSQTQKNNLQVALELYRKAETYVPDNVKLKERIIEIEWAIKNGRPFAPSPKKPRRGPSRRAKSKHRLAPEDDGEEGASGKENADGEEEEEAVGESSGSAKRRRANSKGKAGKGEEEDGEEGEPGTPPKRRRLVKFEEAYGYAQA